MKSDSANSVSLSEASSLSLSLDLSSSPIVSPVAVSLKQLEQKVLVINFLYCRALNLWSSPRTLESSPLGDFRCPLVCSTWRSQCLLVLASPAGKSFLGYFWRLTLGVDEAVVGDVRGHPAAHGAGGSDGVAD